MCKIVDNPVSFTTRQIPMPKVGGQPDLPAQSIGIWKVRNKTQQLILQR